MKEFLALCHVLCVELAEGIELDVANETGSATHGSFLVDQCVGTAEPQTGPRKCQHVSAPIVVAAARTVTATSTPPAAGATHAGTGSACSGGAMSALTTTSKVVVEVAAGVVHIQRLLLHILLVLLFVSRLLVSVEFGALAKQVELHGP